MTEKVFDVEIDGKAFSSFVAAMNFVAASLDRGISQSGMRVKPEMRNILIRVSDRMRELHSGAWDGSVAHSNPVLFSRTGDGLRSIQRSIRERGSQNINTVIGRITTGNMTVHETGATIHPRRSRFLTIPLPAAMDSRGVPLRRRARDWDNTFVQRSRRGNLLIFRRDGFRITPLYLLRESVRIRPRLQMDQTIVQLLPDFEMRALNAIDRSLEAAFTRAA